MIRKTIEIATAGTRLSISHRQLVIERPEQERRTLPCEDIGVLVVDHPQVTYTHPVFTTLLEEGAANRGMTANRSHCDLHARNSRVVANRGMTANRSGGAAHHLRSLVVANRGMTANRSENAVL